MKNGLTGGVIKSPFLRARRCQEVFAVFILCFHSSHELHQLKKRSPSVGHSGYGCEICQYIREYVVSCVRIALCCAGVFLCPHIGTICPEAASPGCRSPPALYSVRPPTPKYRMEKIQITTINLKDSYAWYTEDTVDTGKLFEQRQNGQLDMSLYQSVVEAG